jgi:hypothetical protein
MKLIGESIEIQKDGLKAESSFGIKDENIGFILDMLRSKMYADPISAICREISCNARDAHREVGTPDKPIRINLPSQLDPHYRVIDEGPGITPDRMENVFKNFGASTKRDSNVQTGGFGLGAKTPFAYTDQFQVITVTDISGPREVNSLPRMKRVYTAYIDETKRGIIALMEEIETDQPRGTQICIPIKPENFREFATKTENVCRWWNIQPLIEGTREPFRTIDPKSLAMFGKDWKIYDTQGGNRYVGCDARPVILIDGIAYPLSEDIYNTHQGYNQDAETKQLSILFGGNKVLVLNFPIGQLTLSPNRETIHWSDETKKIVKGKLTSIAKEIRRRLQVDIEAACNYTDACTLGAKLRSMFTTSTDREILALTWRGHKLYESFHQPGYNKAHQWYKFELTNGARNRFNDDDGKRLPIEESHVGRDRTGNYTLSWTEMVVVNDVNLGMLSPKRAAQVFNMIPYPYKAFVLVPDIHVADGSTFGELLQFVPYVRLSAFLKKEDDVPKERKVRKLIYQHTTGGAFALSSIEDFEKDKNEKLWVLLDRDKYDNRLTWPGRKNSVDLLGQLTRDYKVTIFGVEKVLYDKSPAAFAEFENVSTPVLEYIEKKIIPKFVENDLRPYFQNAQGHARPYVESFSKILPLLKCPTDFAEYVRLDGTINEQVRWARHLEFYLNVFDRTMRRPEDVHGISSKQKDPPPAELTQCDLVIKSILERYPLLRHITSDVHNDTKCEHYVSYINMIDADRSPLTKKASTVRVGATQGTKS